MFKNEEKCFKELLKENEFTIAGFSLGAILAFEYVLANPNKRIDTLQLFSPAFFQNHKKSFIRTQLLYFKKDKETYKKNFFKNVFYPKPIPEFWKKEFENLNGDIQELEKLLNFKWNVEDLQKIINRNIQIEVFLGMVVVIPLMMMLVAIPFVQSLPRNFLHTVPPLETIYQRQFQQLVLSG
jgi:esterase/lipase